jgi:predicted dehydrogenase
MMTDWGVHMLDIALLGMKAAGPTSTMSAGGNFGYPWGVQDTPDTLRAIYDFGDFFLSWEHAIGIGNGPYDREHGVAFIGDNGTLVIDRAGWEVLPETASGDMKMEPVPLQPSEDNARDKHAINFIESIKSRKDPICTIETGANVARVAHLGNLAYRVGRKIQWDPQNDRIVNDEEALNLGNAHYRDPWVLNKY